jgi:radical SAM superfamily enzyme YgiQ (UPF0313 family)/ubiquinone/menaquinone biosynthesis C-methylase UbiE
VAKKTNKKQKTVLLFQIYPVWRGPESDRRVPLGMLYLGNSLIKGGFHVEVYHVEEKDIDKVLDEVDFSGVLFVGVCSIMTGFSLRCAIDFSQKLRLLNPTLPIVWGGSQPSAIPNSCLENDFVDAVGIGEGDDLIVDIAKMFDGKMDAQDVKGLAYKDGNGKIIVNERRDFIKNLDNYYADYSLIDLNTYIFNGTISGLIMSSRGCPFSCAFCYNQYFNKRRWRAHSTEYVLDEIKKLRSTYSFYRISFSDDNFFVDNKRAIKILKDLHELKIRTFGVDIKVNNITIDDIKEMRRCQVESVFFGTETLNKRLMSLINKKQNNEMVINTLSNFAKHAPDIAVQTEILMALPFETKNELRNDINEGLELYRYNNNLSVYFGVLFPLPETEMMHYANRNGFNPSTVYDYAQIDLNAAWSICDKWVPFELSKKEMNCLRLTEKYSALLYCDRRFRNLGILAKIRKVKSFLIFHLAKFRVRHWIFAFHKADFYLARQPIIFGNGVARYVVDVLRQVYRRFFKSVDSRVRYRSFGFLPGNSIKGNIIGKVFGFPNLVKRLQAKDVISALEIIPSDHILDFGCGSGYFTVELAKLGQRAFGIDINSYVRYIQIPSDFSEKLKFIQASGAHLPFRACVFDRILASEILPMIEDPRLFLAEMKRVLKAGGKLVVSNGGGHPAIKKAYERSGFFIETLKRRFPDRMPASYNEYCRILQESFGTAQKEFFEEDAVMDLLVDSGFVIESSSYTPGYLAGAVISWSQFILYLRRGETVSQKNFALWYLFLSVISRLGKKRYKGGLIIVAKNDQCT